MLSLLLWGKTTKLQRISHFPIAYPKTDLWFLSIDNVKDTQFMAGGQIEPALRFVFTDNNQNQSNPVA